MTYEQKMEALKQAKIEELKKDIETLRTLNEGDKLPGRGSAFRPHRLSRYLRTAAENLEVAEAADPKDFTGYENLHIIFDDMFLKA